jgi:IMP dehydrogenase
MENIRRALSYNDVLLVPRNSMLKHITDASLKYFYQYSEGCGGFESVPLVNAPMDSICTPGLLHCLHETFNLPVTIHRWFKTPQEQLQFFDDCNFDNDCSNVFLAVGALDKWKNWIDHLLSSEQFAENNFGILVDMANGDTKACLDTVEYLTRQLNVTKIMAGNVATRSGFSRLQDAGANFIRVGIGAGAICCTRTTCGCGIPTLTSIFDCASVKKDDVYLVADGGIEYPGDIMKAMAAGADMVMCGKLFAGTSLTNGELKYDQNGRASYKTYHGQASRKANIALGKTPGKYSIEGVEGLVPYTGETEEVVKEILCNLQTALSYYFGCKNWDEFKRKAKFVEITHNGWEESKTRVKEI